MYRTGLGAALLGAAMMLGQIGCVSPASAGRETASSEPASAEPAEAAAEAAAAPEPTAAPEPSARQVSDLQEKVTALEAEAAALAAQVAAAQEEVAAAQEEAASARAQAAAAEVALSEAETTAVAARAAAAQARAGTEQAQAEVSALRAAAPDPGIRVSAEQLDPGLLDLSAAQVAVAGPDTIYVSSIRYDGQPYSALLRYRGGTTATVERVFAADGATIPGSVDLSQTRLSLVAPNTLEVANVGVGGRGYAGQLRHAGGNELEVAGIQRVTLPPKAAQRIAGLQEQLAAALAEGAQAQAAAGAAETAAGEALAELAAAAAALAEAKRTAAAAAREAQAATAAAGVTQARAEAAVSAAQAEADGLRAAAYQPAAVAVAADRLVPDRLSFATAQASLAGPDTIYVSSITYDGQSYSALLKYRGGTSATVEQVYGPRGKLIPDSVGLGRTRLAFVPPDALNVSYVEVDGQGYSGQLRYTGGNRLEVAEIRRVTLPPTPAQQVAAAEAETLAAQVAAATAATAAAQQVAAAQDEAAAAQAAAAAAVAAAAQVGAELAVLMQDREGRRVTPTAVDFNLLELDRAQVSVAGPESIYVSGIRYDGGELAARLRYTGASRGMVDELFDPASGTLPELDLSAPAIEVLGPETMVISNVGVGGAAHSFTLRFERGGQIVVSQREQGHRVRTAAELLRDELLSSRDVRRVVSGIGAGRALPGEGVWITSAAGVVSQLEADSSHAKFAFRNVPQPAAPTLYGVTVRAGGDRKVGYGLHFLASGTPHSGNTWNFGRSYLMWATRERDFYDTEATQVQLYQSLDGNRLMWLNSRNLLQGLTPGLTLEALYQPADCAAPMGAMPCYGSITVLVDGMEQFKVAVSPEVARQAADTVALRALGGPVEFTDLYVHSRR